MTMLLQNGAGNKYFMKKKLKLESYILKRYEPNLDVYFFYNLCSKEFWETDYLTGSIISQLNGQYSRADIIKTLFFNNKEISKKQLEEYFYNIFDFLINKEFLSENN